MLAVAPRERGGSHHSFLFSLFVTGAQGAYCLTFLICKMGATVLPPLPLFKDGGVNMSRREQHHRDVMIWKPRPSVLGQHW